MMPNQIRRQELLQAALNYARKGWPTFPVHSVDDRGVCACAKRHTCTSPGKHPITVNGLKAASTDENQIRQFWQSHPDANIGIATGNHAGMFVLDIDPRHGGTESLESLQNEIGTFPITPLVKTGGNGFHYYFKQPFADLKNSAGRLPGVDVRAEGGYVLAPPSNHSTGGIYEWTNAGAFEAPIAPVPDLLVSKIRAARTDNGHSQQNTGSFLSGARNDSLTSLGGKLLRSGLNLNELNATLQAANRTRCNPPLSDEEVNAIAASLMRYQQASPAWEEPAPLPAMLPDVMPLTRDMLPEVFSKWIFDDAERAQVAPDLIAAPALCALSGVLGRKVRMRPKQHDDWTVIPNVWGGIIAPPSALKTKCLSEGFRFVKVLEKEAKSDYEAKMKEFAPDSMILEAKIAAVEKQIKSGVTTLTDEETAVHQAELSKYFAELTERKPKLTRYYTNDATTEKISTILAENPNGLIIFRDELSGLLTSMDKVGRESDRAFYLECWTGNSSFTSDRVGRGTTSVTHCCLTIIGGIQPDILQDFFSKNLADLSAGDGFLARFQLLVFPDQDKVFTLVDRAPDLDVRKAAEKVFRDANTLNGVHPYLQIDDEASFSFDEAAQEYFNSWYHNLEMRLRSGEFKSSAFLSHMGKYRSLMPSLALLFHLIKLFSGAYSFQVNIDSCMLAVKWCEYLESHARRVYAGTLAPQNEAAHRLAERILDGEVIDQMSVRDIYRKQWKGLHQEKVRSAISMLQELNWVFIQTIESKQTGGAPMEILRINPNLRNPKLGGRNEQA